MELTGVAPSTMVARAGHVACSPKGCDMQNEAGNKQSLVGGEKATSHWAAPEVRVLSVSRITEHVLAAAHANDGTNNCHS
jgi:hypothetical protein